MKWLPSASVLTALCVGLCAAAADPKIIGPEKVAPYKSAKLSASDVAPDSGILWEITGKAADDGRTLFQADVERIDTGKEEDFRFIGPPGLYELSLTEFGQPKEGRRPVVKKVSHLLTILSPLPPTPPKPKPDDGKPDDKPDVKPSTSPIEADGLHVIILYDSAKKTQLSRSQLVVIEGIETRAWLDQNCAPSTGPGGQTTAGYRIYPATIQADFDADWVKKAVARPRASLPWYMVGNGKTGQEGPLDPAVTAKSFIELAGRYK